MTHDDPAMQTGADRGAVLESDLRHALAQQQFVLYYQPVFDHNSQMVGAEALIRWQHPRKGLVGPCDFIGQSEKSDLVVEIGQWALESACRQLAAWRGHEATRALSIAVNISARQARQPDFVERVTGAVAASGADPVLLKLELTESMLLGNVDDMVAKMGALKAHGVGFALGRDLGLEVIAEGVEHEDQRRALVAWGCHRFQGYLYSAPVAAGELARWFTAARVS